MRVGWSFSPKDLTLKDRIRLRANDHRKDAYQFIDKNIKLSDAMSSVFNLGPNVWMIHKIARSQTVQAL